MEKHTSFLQSTIIAIFYVYNLFYCSISNFRFIKKNHTLPKSLVTIYVDLYINKRSSILCNMLINLILLILFISTKFKFSIFFDSGVVQLIAVYIFAYAYSSNVAYRFYVNNKKQNYSASDENRRRFLYINILLIISLSMYMYCKFFKF